MNSRDKDLKQLLCEKQKKKHARVCYSFQSKSRFSPSIFLMSVTSCETSNVPRSQVFSVFVAHRQVSYISQAVVQVNPELGNILLPNLEGLHDSVYYGDAFALFFRLRLFCCCLLSDMSCNLFLLGAKSMRQVVCEGRYGVVHV